MKALKAMPRNPCLALWAIGCAFPAVAKCLLFGWLVSGERFRSPFPSSGLKNSKGRIQTSTSARAYPIASSTWVLVPEHINDTEKRAAMADFLRWMLTGGQSDTMPLNYAPQSPTESCRDIQTKPNPGSKQSRPSLYTVEAG